MNVELEHLAGRIRAELEALDHLRQRIAEGWKRAAQASDDYYLDSVALNLHGLYSGLERLFELIAAVLDNAVPTGDKWHHALLQQMTAEVVEVRPAVISKTVCDHLDEYRRFRHVVRNVYAFNFDPGKIAKLVENSQPVFAQVRAELLAFADFLEHRASIN